MFGPDYVGVRKLWSLVRGLPADGAFIRSVQGERWAPQMTETLLAAQVECTHAVLRAVMASGGAKKHDIPKPLRVPRPGDPEVKRDIPLDQLAKRVRERKSEGGVDGEGR